MCAFVIFVLSHLAHCNGGPDDTGSDTGTIADTGDTANTDTGSCGLYTVTSGGHGYESYSYPTATLVYPTDDTVILHQGEDLVMEVELDVQDGCGSYSVTAIDFTLDDCSVSISDYPITDFWFEDLHDSYTTSFLTEMNASEDLGTTTMNTYGYGTCAQTWYMWQSVEGYFAAGATTEIDTQHISASSPKRYRFTWQGSEYAPVGTEVTFDLDMAWFDDVNGSMPHLALDRALTVQIIE